MQLLDVGGIKPSCFIDGVGTCEAKGSSPRIYYTGTWKNVEFSADVKVFPANKSKGTGGVEQSYLVARSNHEDRDPDGFGGYYLYVDIPGKSMFFKKEISHKEGYSSRLASVKCDVSENEWFNQKIVVKNEGDKVIIEGHLNGKLMTSLTDEGQIKCEDKPTKPYLGVGKWCFSRSNNLDKLLSGVTVYKNVIINSLTS